MTSSSTASTASRTTTTTTGAAMTKDEALERTRALLAEEYGPELRTSDGNRIVLRDDLVGEYDEAWLVPFNTRAYLDGDVDAALVPSAVLVPKDETVRAHYPPTAFPVARYLAEIRAGTLRWLDGS